ncbi:MAG TPA: outer membrane beta-barrel protein [Acidiferrobacterales bacterium]
MKIKTSILAGALSATLLGATTAHAAPPVTDFAGDRVYLGAKFIVVDLDDIPPVSFDKAYNIGVYGGYHLLGQGAQIPKNLGGGTLSIEGEFTTTVVDGDTNFGGDWDITTISAYAAYRFPLQGGVYLKGKAGGTWSDPDTPATRKSETDGSFGLGVGWHLGSGALEGEFTVISSELLFLSVGYLF